MVIKKENREEIEEREERGIREEERLKRKERNEKIVLERLMEEIPEEEYEKIVIRMENGEEIKNILKELKIEEGEIEKSKIRKPTRFPWEEIERIYTHGKKKYLSNGKVVLEYPTIEELAKIYGCGAGTMRVKSMEGKWGIKRDLLKKRRKQEMYREVYGVLNNEATMHDAKLLGKLERIDEILENQLTLVEETTNLEERIDPREIKSLLECLEKSHGIARKLYGEPTNLYEIEKEIERARRDKEQDKKIRTENAVGLLDTLIKRKEKLERRKERRIEEETIEVEVKREETEK